MEKTTPNAYAAEHLRAGVTPDLVRQNLLAVGWPEEEVGAAIVSGLVSIGVPVPSEGALSGRGKLSSTVEVILNFFSFITLASVATSLSVLYYQIINNYFPDPLIIRYGVSDVSPETVHYAIAALIVSFPIYLVAVHLWFRRFRDDAEKTETKLTKWLTYLVLLVSAVTIVGDLITAVFYLLQGEVTARFFLKALTILVIAGVIFGFYFLERKKIQYRKDISRSIFLNFGRGVTLLVVIGIICGFIVGGSPQAARKSGFDTQRANDLRELASCVVNLSANQKKLPDTLSELSQSGQYAYCSSNLVDPETGTPYEYQVVTPSEVNGTVRDGKFELCAVFSLNSADNAPTTNSYGFMNDKWSKHGAGRNCDSETAALERSADTSFSAPKPAMPVPVK